jgi:hypothetical protein
MRTLVAFIFVLAVNPAFAEPSCKKQVDSAFAKLRETKAFRLSTTITNREGTLKMEADYILPDRMHQKVMLGGDGTAMEMIVIGKKAWSNQGGGWAELPEKFAETVADQIKQTVTEAPKVVTDYKCLGDKDFEGKNYKIYQGILATPLPADAKDKGPRLTSVAVPNQQSVYIDKITGLPARNIVTSVTEPDKRLFDGTFTVVHDMSIEPPKVSAN